MSTPRSVIAITKHIEKASLLAVLPYASSSREADSTTVYVSSIPVFCIKAYPGLLEDVKLAMKLGRGEMGSDLGDETTGGLLHEFQGVAVALTLIRQHIE